MAIMAGEAITESGTAGMRGASRARRARRARRAEERIQDRTKGGRGRPANRRYERGEYGYGRVLVEEPDELYEPPGGGGGGDEGGGGRPGGRRGGGRGRDFASGYANQAQAVGRGAQIAPGRSSHQGAILAEFLVCVLIIVITPIATGGSGTGPSPYSANDLKRLVALGAVFFGLALVPGDNGSKVAAWLGGLVMLVVLMNTLQSGDLGKVLGIFSQGGTEPPGATTPSG